MGIFFPGKNGWSANNLVSKPSFSALAKASSVVPVLSQSFLKILKPLELVKFLESGWSTDKAIKLAPKIVSGLVVNTSIFSLDELILNVISQPKDLPIQFFCINLTFSGHPLKLSKSSKSSLENFVIFKNHCDNFFLSTGALDLQPLPLITCSFAKTVCSIGSQFTYVSLRDTKPLL